MSLVALYNPTDTLSQINNYALFAEARAGGQFAPEAAIGTASRSNAEQVDWYDADDAGGLVTGTVPVKLDANLATGVDTWSVAGGLDGPVTFNGPTGKTINYVELVAGVQVGAKVSWSNVQVSFYKGGVLQETINVGTAPSIDTRSTGDTGEQVETITPTDPNDDEAIVTGNIRLTAPDGTYYAPDDLFAQAFVIAN